MKLSSRPETLSTLSDSLHRQLSMYALAASLLLAPCTWAAKYKVLYSFQGGADGIFPFGALVLDKSGNLYGTTSAGGNGNCYYDNYPGCGTAFMLSRQKDGTWQHQILYSFHYSDGEHPNGDLTFGSAGNLYGTNWAGGSAGWGTVFELIPQSGGQWTESVLYNFTGSSDGADPSSGLLVDRKGNLYGMTFAGGKGGGVVFELTPRSGGWVESVLFTFCSPGCGGGLGPSGPLTLAKNGSFYGTTEFGGEGYGPGYGVVFRLEPVASGWEESAIHSFVGQDGGTPGSGVTLGKNGRLYGTTNGDGAFGYGTVYRLTPGANGRWKERVLYNFRSGSTQSGSLSEGVLVDAAGNIFGVNGTGGVGSCDLDSGCGMVYKLIPSAHGRSKYSALHSFTGGAGGAMPFGSLVFGPEGKIYGTTSTGGATGNGVVFEITP